MWTIFVEETLMKISRLWLPLLSSLLLACVGNPQGSETVSGNDTSDEEPSVSEGAEQLAWPYPDQERLVDEPIFNGKLHLVEAGQANQQTIILVHGLGYRGVHDWVQVIPQLMENYHVIAIDLPGFGGSDKHQMQYAPQRYSQLVNWVASQFAHGPVVVIGHSMGGAVSLRYAHNYPEQVSRLIMVDAAGILQRTIYIKYLAKVPVTYEWLMPYQKSFPGLDKFIRKVAGKADGWTQSLLVMMDKMPDIPQLMMSSGLAQRFLYKDRSTLNAALGLVYEDFSGTVREVGVPTHIIWGEDDSVAPIRTGTLLANIMSNAELHVIRDAGHVPMTDNFSDFMEVLNYSLINMPQARQAENRLSLVKKEPGASRDIHCDGKQNLSYTGHYGKVSLENCHGVVLSDLVAESIELINSEVTLENVALKSDEIALKVVDSVVVSTLLQVDSKIGITVENSYLDFAGADFVFGDKFVEIKKASQLYFSLSQTRQGEQIKPLHGVSIGTVLQVH